MLMVASYEVNYKKNIYICFKFFLNPFFAFFTHFFSEGLKVKYLSRLSINHLNLFSLMYLSISFVTQEIFIQPPGEPREHL